MLHSARLLPSARMLPSVRLLGLLNSIPFIFAALLLPTSASAESAGSAPLAMTPLSTTPFSITPGFGAEDDVVVIHGSGFLGDPERYSVTLRDGLGGGSTASVLAAEPERLIVRLDPAAAAFVGGLEIHQGLTQHLPDLLIELGPRRYLASSIEWHESTCRVEVGPFQIIASSAGATPSVDTSGGVLLVILKPMADGIKDGIMLQSEPPDPCGIRYTTKTLSSGSFTARLDLELISGPVPTTADNYATDFAAVLDQVFAGFGLTANSEGDQLLLSGADLAGGFATLTVGSP